MGPTEWVLLLIYQVIWGKSCSKTLCVEKAMIIDTVQNF
jgi:hypothetical protein